MFTLTFDEKPDDTPDATYGQKKDNSIERFALSDIGKTESKLADMSSPPITKTLLDDIRDEYFQSAGIEAYKRLKSMKYEINQAIK